MLLPVAVCLAVYSYEKPITDPTVMANIEVLTSDDDPGGWWDSKVYICTSTSVWQYKCMYFKDIPIGKDEIYVGPPHDPYDWCCGMFKVPSSDCLSGSSVAHCWEC